MPTALDIISRALKVRRVLGRAQTATGAEASDALVSLNAMLKTWSASRALINAITRQQLTLVAGTSSYTIGASGAFNTERPTRLEPSFVRFNGVDYPVEVIALSAYESIGSKADSGMPEIMAYRATYPLGTIYLYPTPNADAAGASAFYLSSWKQLQEFASLTTDYALPPEDEEALVYGLARRLGGFGGRMDQEDLRIASETYNTIRNVNSTPRAGIQTDIGHFGGQHIDNILTG